MKRANVAIRFFSLLRTHLSLLPHHRRRNSPELLKRRLNGGLFSSKHRSAAFSLVRGIRREKSRSPIPNACPPKTSSVWPAASHLTLTLGPLAPQRGRLLGGRSFSLPLWGRWIARQRKTDEVDMVQR